jgi:hypothetical protein
LNSLVEPGYFGLNKDSIIIIRNFVEPEHLKTVQKFLPTINEWMDPGESQYSENGTCLYNADYWRNRQCGGEIIQKLNSNIYKIIEFYIDKMQKVLTEKFSVQLSSRPPVLIKWTPGTEQKPHADKQLNDGSPNPFPDYDLNSLIYYNDNFEGGELYYPEHDIVIKPEPGLAVAHPGDIHFLHGVKRIISGERWTTPSFYTVKEFL